MVNSLSINLFRKCSDWIIRKILLEILEMQYKIGLILILGYKAIHVSLIFEWQDAQLICTHFLLWFIHKSLVKNIQALQLHHSSLDINLLVTRRNVMVFLKAFGCDSPIMKDNAVKKLCCPVFIELDHLVNIIK